MSTSILKTRDLALLGGFFIVLFGMGIRSQLALAAPIEIPCPAEKDLNACVAEACDNPMGGRVLLGDGTYDANISSAQVSCPGGVSLIGQGAEKTILVSNGANINDLVRGNNGKAAVALGFITGNVGDVSILDLSIRCGSVDPNNCPVNGARIFRAESAHVSGVRIEGFRRGLLMGSDNAVVEGNTIEGLGNGLRGVWVPGGPQGPIFHHLSIEGNYISGVEIGLSLGIYKDLKVVENTMVNVGVGMQLQFFNSPAEFSSNRIESTGPFSIYFGHGSGDATFSQNMLCGPGNGFFLDNTAGAGSDLILEENEIQGTHLTAIVHSSIDLTNVIESGNVFTLDCPI